MSEVFAGRVLTEVGSRFVCGFWERFATGAPVLRDAPAAFDCRLVETVAVGSHLVLIGRVVDTATASGRAAFIRSRLHRYSAFPFVQRVLYIADMLIGAALHNARQTGLERQRAVQEKLAELACYRETINAHLVAALRASERGVPQLRLEEAARLRQERRRPVGPGDEAGKGFTAEIRRHRGSKKRAESSARRRRAIIPASCLRDLRGSIPRSTTKDTKM